MPCSPVNGKFTRIAPAGIPARLEAAPEGSLPVKALRSNMMAPVGAQVEITLRARVTARVVEVERDPGAPEIGVVGANRPCS